MRGSIISVRLVIPMAAAILVGASTGCTTQAACFDDCDGKDDRGSGGENQTGGSSLGSQPNLGSVGGSSFNLGGNQSKAGMGQLEDAGTQCEGVDLQTDLNNCGACGNVCIFTGAEASCIAGECVIGMCNESRYDLDGDPNNGCEYACEPTGLRGEDCATSADPDCGTVEYCDERDNDCDGAPDNGFDLQHDPNNCGACGNKCELLHATAECAPLGGAATCIVQTCEEGWNDANQLNKDGCEYACTPTGKNGENCSNSSDPNCGKVEYCDAYDNDCNNLLNDGNENNGGPEGGEDCYGFDYCNAQTQSCKGECTPGISTCAGDKLVCIPDVTPGVETCDGLDNDCDGTKDNGFKLDTDTLNCGACGKSCIDALPNAVAKCVSSKCAIAGCKPGYADLTNAPGCEYKCPKFPTSAETCNGIDDDCNGVVDDAAAIAPQKPGVVAFCNNGRALGTTPCAGATVTCSGTEGWACNYLSPLVEIDPATKRVRVVEALCDDQDGNCDGQKDEAFLNKGKACAAGQGACARSATYACTADHLGTECDAAAVPTDARDESCNGIDDNCDGQVDERSPKAGSTCYSGPNGAGPHACAGYIDPMVKVGSTWVYTYEASRPDATASDAGFDNSRSCSKAGVLPWTSVSHTEAKAVCESLPTSVANTKMRLCTESEWQSACLAGGSAATETWSFSASPTTYDDQVCNDAAAGRSAPWATAFVNAGSGNNRCRTGTQIWDMSGNVGEWTSTCITVLGKEYCRVRGGSFLSQGPATSCNFSFVLDIPSFANFDLGFRCCSSAAP